MSNLNAVRAPAWPGLKPNPTQFSTTAPESLANAVLTAAARRGRLYGDNLKHQRQNYLRLRPNDGGKALFFKVLAQSEVATQLAADRIAKWLDQGKIATNILAPGYPLTLDNDHCLLGYPLIEGRFAEPSEQDLCALGSLLGQTHRRLATLPGWRDIRKTAEKRELALAQRRLQLLQDPKLLPTEQRPKTEKILAASATRLPEQEAQAIHGDLNLGNVLFRTSNDQPVLLDLEETQRHWTSPKVDLAMAVERFVLAWGQNERALPLAEALFSGYRAIYPGPIQWPEGGICDLLKRLSTRALCILSLSEQASDEEWNKFFTLFEQADTVQGLLSQIEQR